MRYLALVGVAVFGLILWKTDFHAVARIVWEADPWLLAACVVLLIPTFALKILRWRKLLALTGIDLGLGRSASLYLGSMFLASATPGRAGEIAKAFFLRSAHGVPLGRSLVSVIIDRLSEVVVLAGLGLVGGVLLATGFQQLLYPIVAIICGLLVALLLLLNRKLVDALFTLITRAGLLRKYEASMQVDLDHFYSALHSLRRPAIIVPLLQTVASTMCFLFICYLSFRALHLPVPFRTVIVSVSIAKLVALVPITVAGLGTRESAFIYLFGLAGVGRDAVMTFSFLYIFLFNILINIAGGIAWVLSPIRRTTDS